MYKYSGGGKKQPIIDPKSKKLRGPTYDNLGAGHRLLSGPNKPKNLGWYSLLTYNPVNFRVGLENVIQILQNSIANNPFRGIYRIAVEGLTIYAYMPRDLDVERFLRSELAGAATLKKDIFTTPSISPTAISEEKLLTYGPIAKQLGGTSNRQLVKACFYDEITVPSQAKKAIALIQAEDLRVIEYAQAIVNSMEFMSASEEGTTWNFSIDRGQLYGLISFADFKNITKENNTAITTQQIDTLTQPYKDSIEFSETMNLIDPLILNHFKELIDTHAIGLIKGVPVPLYNEADVIRKKKRTKSKTPDEQYREWLQELEEQANKTNNESKESQERYILVRLGTEDVPTGDDGVAKSVEIPDTNVDPEQQDDIATKNLNKTETDNENATKDKPEYELVSYGITFGKNSIIKINFKINYDGNELEGSFEPGKTLSDILSKEGEAVLTEVINDYAGQVMKDIPFIDLTTSDSVEVDPLNKENIGNRFARGASFVYYNLYKIDTQAIENKFSYQALLQKAENR